MTLIEFLHGETKRLHGLLDGTLTGLTAEQLHAVPSGHPKANTIAWGLWHYTRTEDNLVRPVFQDRRPSVWQEGGYAETLGLPPLTQGTGMTTEEAHALRITDVDLFREYMLRVWASTEELFTNQFFDKTITLKGRGDMPVGRALGQLCVAHGLMHFGEMELARTLVGAKPVVGV